ncbi:hypothetical protein EIP86_008709 [Pleurotus ostreatoroseus]|nr:hypothetical protein EIP86_008709 [Pleurotus ostreatoroseus]
MSFWFALEFWIYNRHDGRKWLADVLWSEWNNFTRHPLVRKGLTQPREIWDQGKRVGRFLTQTAIDDPEMLQEPARPIGFHRRHQSVVREVLEPPAVSFWLAMDKDSMKANEIARYRWQEAVRRILDSHHVQRTPLHGRLNFASTVRFAHLHNIVPSVRSGDMIQKLQQMEITQKVVDEDTVREGLVKFLEFSPSGRLLVTSSWNGRSFVSEVADNLLRQRTFAHPINLGFVKQIEWSPQGDMVLMRSNRSITVFKKDDGSIVYKHEQDDHPIRSVAWLQQDAQEAISIEGEKIIKLSAVGEEIKLQFREPRIEKFKIREVVITKDSRWMICVGKTQGPEREDGKVAVINKEKHEIILYNLPSLAVVKRHRVYHEISSISLTFDNNYALISYENKAPPQLWRLQGRWGKDAQLCLETTYMPREPTHFAALPSSLGGTKDEFVLRAAAGKRPGDRLVHPRITQWLHSITDGDIFFWHTYTGRMLYRLAAPSSLGHLTAFAWNRKADTWMLATGTHEGVVYIWTIPTPERPAIPLSISAPNLKRHFTTSEATLYSPSTSSQRRSYTMSSYGLGDRSTDSPVSRMMYVLPEDRATRTLVAEPESAESHRMRRKGSGSDESSAST